MTAPTTCTFSGTYLRLDGSTATGRVEFRANLTNASRFVNNDNVIEVTTFGYAIPQGGVTPGMVSATLARCSSGYTVTEYIDGAIPHSYNVPDQAGPVDLGTFS